MGESWKVPDAVKRVLQEFVCALYSQPKLNNVNKARAVLLHKMVGKEDGLNTSRKIDFAKLPPDLNSLTQHINRVNYRTKCYKMADKNFPELVNPYENDQGWKLQVSNDSDGSGEAVIEPCWFAGSLGNRCHKL